jgi:[phosphatase 2A protein]-leucine-carboxy methyltransferase
MNNLRLPTPRGSSGLKLRSIHTDLSSTADAKDAKDRTVQQTDQDASQSRVSAVETGYLQDDFAQAFCAQKGARKFPLINRGIPSHARSHSWSLQGEFKAPLCARPPSTGS